MPGRIGFTMLDYSREKASFSFPTADITAGTLPGTLTEIGAFRAAVEGITLGVVSDEKLLVFDTNLSNTPPASPLAQVETSWLVTYEDNQGFFDAPTNSIPNEGFGRIFTMTIPTADIAAAGRLAPNSDDAVLTETNMAAFVTAFEDSVHSPYGGTVNVLKITHVGRNR